MTIPKRVSYSLFIMTGLFIINSYHSAMAGQNASIDLSKPISEALLAQYNRDGIELDYDKTPVLKQVFVTDNNGAVARQLPSGAARKLKDYTFGEKLEVIEEQKDWYGVRDRIYREDNDGVTKTDVVKWEKVYVKKAQTGSINKISLTTSDLSVINNLLVNGEYKNFENGKKLNKYLKFELIDKALFESKRPLAVNFLSKDKVIKKKNGALSIATPKKLVKLVDIDTDDDGRASFEYIGQINALNQHLVFGQFWEISNYTMFDKTSGKQTQDFVGYPYLSTNEKHIIAIYADPYGEQHTDLELYRIQNNKIIPIMSAEFKNWVAASNPEDIFWARDGYLYLAVTHSAIFLNEEDDNSDLFQYIRIKVD